MLTLAVCGAFLRRLSSLEAIPCSISAISARIEISASQKRSSSACGQVSAKRGGCACARLSVSRFL